MSPIPDIPLRRNSFAKLGSTFLYIRDQYRPTRIPNPCHVPRLLPHRCATKSELSSPGPSSPANPRRHPPSDNRYSWSRNSSMLYIESPAGVGFSYCDYSPCASNDTSTAEDAYDAVTGFFAGFPEHKSAPFYITGESCNRAWNRRCARSAASPPPPTAPPTTPPPSQLEQGRGGERTPPPCCCWHSGVLLYTLCLTVPHTRCPRCPCCPCCRVAACLVTQTPGSTARCWPSRS